MYPEEAKPTGSSGVVILEVVIDTTGRVHDVKVLRSNPPFDLAASEAVRQWAFTPTLVNGVARPVAMTVTVNFALQ